MQTEKHYCVETVSVGSWGLWETTNRDQVRTLTYLAGSNNYMLPRVNTRLNVREGRKFQNGKILASYIFDGARWVHAYGNTVTGLDGKDCADLYQMRYDFVTRAHAEYMVGMRPTDDR